ncbi:MAG TPA: ABC transporter substrate-binding protein [Rugosimonospora sp.]|nr:ABC transporter substrate-binding protein [Rugosimonospora sp.]
MPQAPRPYPRRAGYVLIALACTATLAVTSCGRSTSASNPGTIRIGLLAALSGTYAAVGRDMRDGFQLYLDTHGGKLGGHPVQLYIGDEGDGPATALPAATKMIKENKVQAMTGVVGGGTVAALMPLLNQAKIPLVSSNGRPNLKDVTREWHTSFLSDEPGAAIAQYVHDSVAGDVFAIGPDYQGGYDELRGFTDTFKKVGGHLANPDGKATFTPFPTTTNFTPYFAQIKASGAKAVYCFYAGTSAVDFVKQYAQSDVKDLPLYAAGFLTEGGVLAAQGPAARGIYSVLNYSPDLDNAANRSFTAAWRARHDGAPTTYAMASFDAGAVLDRAIAAAGPDPTPDAINAAIGNIGEIDSPRGTWEFSRTTHAPVQKWYLRQVRPDGRALSNTVVESLLTLGA